LTVVYSIKTSLTCVWRDVRTIAKDHWINN